MMTGGSRDDFMSDINVTPFVDVMLVLLIIFMVTAPMMMQGVDVSLPEATSEPLETEEDNLIITIDKNNLIYISDYQVTVEFLREKLIKILEGRRNREVFLKADRDISYGTVVQVMSELKGAGVDKLGMVTEPEILDTEDKKPKVNK
jgi:biopolymer transport protein TolR